MKLSNETLTVLKNFASINQGIQFKQGKKIKTMSSGKSVLAEANLKDEFPQDFCVYDLNQFLLVYNLFKDSPELDFDNINILFKNGKRQTKYRMTEKDQIVTPPDRELKLDSAECEFTLSAEDYHWIMDTAKAVSSPNIAVESDGETISLITFDAKDNSAHTNSIEVGQSNGKSYKVVFNTDNIKMIPGSYNVRISFKGISHWQNTKEDLQYWIAFEAKDSKVA